MTGNDWTRSSFCADTACVEVRRTDEGVLVRDSKDLDQKPFRFSLQEWADFLTAVKAGEFGA